MGLRLSDIELIVFHLMLGGSILMGWHTDTIIAFILSVLVIQIIKIKEKMDK